MRELAQFLSRMAIIALLVMFGIFYGVDLATNGIGQVNGPLKAEQEAGRTERVLEAAEETARADAGNADEERASPFDRLEKPVHNTTLVNALADAAGNVLQRTARGSIELIVSLFDGILH